MHNDNATILVSLPTFSISGKLLVLLSNQFNHPPIQESKMAAFMPMKSHELSAKRYESTTLMMALTISKMSSVSIIQVFRVRYSLTGQIPLWSCAPDQYSKHNWLKELYSMAFGKADDSKLLPNGTTLYQNVCCYIQHTSNGEAAILSSFYWSINVILCYQQNINPSDLGWDLLNQKIWTHFQKAWWAFKTY